MPESVTDRPTKAHEYLYLLSKRPRYYFDAEAVREKAASTGYEDAVLKSNTPGWSGNPNVHGEKGHALPGAWTNGGGRNIRSVWEIATQPYPEAHFATFPEELARRCIAAGCPEQVCRVCGKARERVVAKTPVPHWKGGSVTGSGERGDYGANGAARFNYDVSTLGFTDCDCNPSRPALGAWQIGDDTTSAHKYRPGIVLDPFIGSGTVAYVARKLGRHSIGIDLNKTYLELAARRLQQQSLFAEAL